MTYGIVVRHDGQITVESEPGRGSTFRLTFPTKGVSAAVKEAPKAPALSPVAPLRCLVIDDEEYVANMLADVLHSAGHTAVVFTDPAAALARIEAEGFDVVFTDLAMPGMAGWQVASAIKAVRPETVVLLMTGYGVELSPEECQRHDIDAVLTKPVGVDAILETVVRIATKRSSPLARKAGP
jgi:CheY-like chemotaxis protein